MNGVAIACISTALEIMSVALYSFAMFRSTKHKMTGWLIGVHSLDLLTYIIVGGKTGMASSISNLGRDIAYSKFDNKHMTLLFSIVRIALLAFSYEGVVTLLFIIMHVITTVITLKGTAQQLRFASLANQFVWVAYDYMFVNIVVASITFAPCIGLVTSIVKNWNSKPVYE